MPEVRILPMEEWLRAISTGLAVGEELRIAAIRDMFVMGHCSFSLDRTKTAAVLELIVEEAGPKNRSEVGKGREVSRCHCPPIGVEYLRGMMESSW